jgi:hypothetical protein
MNAELIALGIVIASLSFAFGVYIGLGAREGTEDAQGYHKD